MLVKKIISGGQTGVDRAALDTAIEQGIYHGGYCPKGRGAEDGIIPSKYDLIEIESVEYDDRTHANVVLSDGTLVLHSGTIDKGTALTKEYCIQREKPILIINILGDLNLGSDNYNKWIMGNSIHILNIAGPRESECGIYKAARNALRHLL